MLRNQAELPKWCRPRPLAAGKADGLELPEVACLRFCHHSPAQWCHRICTGQLKVIGSERWALQLPHSIGRSLVFLHPSKRVRAAQVQARGHGF